MKVLITGADGYIGSVLQHHFVSRGWDVTGVVFVREPKQNEYLCNISDAGSVAGLPPGPYDLVIHTAGIVNYSAGFVAMKAVNTVGAANMARWATRTGCRHFIHISSVSVYGFHTLGQRRTENYAWGIWKYLGNPYMRTKAAAEKRVRTENSAYTMLRLPAVIGAADTFTSPVIYSRLKSGDFFFCGKGNKKVSLISVENIGFIIERLFEHGPANNVYNCCDYHINWRDLVAEFADQMGLDVPAQKKSILRLPGYINDQGAQMLFTYSCFGAHFPDDRLRNLIGDARQHHWKETVREAVEYLDGKLKTRPPVSG